MVVDFGLVTVIGMSIALIVGKLLKDNPAINNKLIPWVTLLISVLTQAFHPTAALASIGGVVGSPFGSFILQALFQWFTTTGIHSAAKNMTEKAKP